jgi:hypothetical protein
VGKKKEKKKNEELWIINEAKMAIKNKKRVKV